MRHFMGSGDAFRILITAMSLIGLTVAWDEFRTRQWLQILGPKQKMHFHLLVLNISMIIHESM